ncbi:MAG: glycosyltransferase family 2 protein, partial [Candidatus Saccharibacteria bacterium]|nr:glycosyltransferase family 2 protein [Candidatus Saccharibacteria bacterium]
KWMKEAKKWSSNEKVALRARMQILSDSPKYDGLILPKKNTVRNFSGPLTLLSKAMHRFILPIPEAYPNEDTWWSCCIEYFADYVSLIEDIVVYYRVHEGNSISRTSTFDLFNEKYHIRQIIRRDFLNRFNQELTKDQKARLQRELDLEEARYQGRKLPILLASDISIVHRARLLFLSGKCFYALKLKFDRFFLGH